MAKTRKKADVKSRASKTLYSAPALEKGFDIIELLATAPDGLTSSEIAQRLGFDHAEYMGVAFKKFTGKSPGEYRRANRVDLLG